MKPVSRLISRIDEEFTDDEEELPQLYQQQQDDEEEEDGEQVDHKDSKVYFLLFHISFLTLSLDHRRRKEKSSYGENV